MPDPNCSSPSHFSKQLITETVQAVLKELAKDNPFAQLVFNTPQAARFLKISPSLLACLRAKNKGPRYLKIESAIRYKRCDIEDWLAEL